MSFFRNKFIVSVLVLATAIYLLSAPVAQAGDGLGTILSVVATVALVAVAVVQPEMFLVLGTGFGETFLMYETIGELVYLTSYTQIIEYGVTALGVAIGGSITSGIIACAEGLICPGGQTSGLLLVPVSAQGSGCFYQIPSDGEMSFYNWQSSQLVVNPVFVVYPEWLSADQIYKQPPIGEYVPRFKDSSCSIPITDPYSSDNKYAGFGDDCMPITCIANCTSTTPSESSLQVQFYRFTLSGDSDQAALNNWFLNTITSNAGSGWETPADYRNSSGITPIAVGPYSDCEGNVCKFKDATVPENSYVAYMAKISGNYTFSYSYSCGSDGEQCFETKTGEGKFLNTDNVSWGALLPYSSGLGNTIIGPFKTGSCPTNGSCSATHYNCSAGALGATAEYSTQWQWWCDGLHGGTNILCSEMKSVPINGSCSTTHYNCSAGNLGDTAEYTSQWNWWCNGSNGGTNILCSEMKSTPPPASRPHISLAPSSFYFSGTSGGTDPSSQTLTISNTGNAVLSWNGSTNQGWCHISSTSGNIGTGSSQAVTVTVDSPSNVGTFNCNITISGSNADNSPQTAGVTYAVVSAPVSVPSSPKGLNSYCPAP